LKTSRKCYWDKSRYIKLKNKLTEQEVLFLLALLQQFKTQKYSICNDINERAPFITIPLQVLDQTSQTQATIKSTSNQLTWEVQNHLVSIKLLNQSLDRYLDRVEGWKDVIEETEEKMKTLTEEQYDIKATAQQVNTTVALR